MLAKGYNWLTPVHCLSLETFFYASIKNIFYFAGRISLRSNEQYNLYYISIHPAN